MAVAPGLADEDDLVDARLGVAPHEGPDLRGGADRPSQRSEPLLEELGRDAASGLRRHLAVEAPEGTVGRELLPDVRAAGRAVAEDVVVRQRVAEEVPAVETPPD